VIGSPFPLLLLSSSVLCVKILAKPVFFPHCTVKIVFSSPLLLSAPPISGRSSKWRRCSSFQTVERIRAPQSSGSTPPLSLADFPIKVPLGTAENGRTSYRCTFPSVQLRGTRSAPEAPLFLPPVRHTLSPLPSVVNFVLNFQPPEPRKRFMVPFSRIPPGPPFPF